jgi:hypothetical protein
VQGSKLGILKYTEHRGSSIYGYDSKSKDQLELKSGDEMCPGMSGTCWYWPQVEEWFATDAYKCVALDICQSVFHLSTHEKIR